MVVDLAEEASTAAAADAGSVAFGFEFCAGDAAEKTKKVQACYLAQRKDES
jgi:hypothetical protein